MTKSHLLLLPVLFSILLSTRLVAAPAIWQVSDQDNRIWLLGSIHVLDQKTQWQTPLLRAKIDQAEWFYYETDLSEETQGGLQPLIGQLGLNAPGQGLSTQLSQQVKQRLTAVVNGLGMPMAQIEPLKPWLASVSLSMTAMQKAGYQPQRGVEMTLGILTADSKERFFETPEQQMRFLAELSDEVQMQLLHATLVQLQEEPNLFDEMTTAWADGNTDVLDRLLNESLDDVDATLKQVLIDERNRRWVEELSGFMQGKDDALVVVGAGHLVGEHGVPALLQAKGFSVTRIQ